MGLQTTEQQTCFHFQSTRNLADETNYIANKTPIVKIKLFVPLATETLILLKSNIIVIP